MDIDSGDPQPSRFFHFKGNIADDNLFALGRVALQLLKQPTADGIHLIVFDNDASQIVDILDQHSAFDRDVFAVAFNAWTLILELIMQIADNFFKDFFSSQESGGAAVFIDYQCQLGLVLLHQSQRMADLH
ncbi:hypothetical protein D3C80_1622310 [compost metagenome]